MHIGFDISSLPFGTGVSRYTSNLLAALVPLLHSPDQLTLFGSSLRQKQALMQYADRYPDMIKKLYSFPPSLVSVLFNQLNLPITALTGNLDVFQAWDWYTPNPGKARLVSTVHDVALFKYPDTAHPSIKHHHEISLTRLKKYNATIIAVSQATKNDLIEFFSFQPNQITVIPEALPQELNVIPSKEQLIQVKQEFALTKPYMLIVGTREPRKNHERQIQAWHPFKADYDLVVVGKSGWETLTPEPGLKLLGYVDGLKLAALYRGAEVLLYASLYEGFGLPILEGFFHQVPVVTANVSAMPEVAGDAAVLADPLNHDSLVYSINQALQYKDTWVKKGLERLRHFSWGSTARQTLLLYNSLFINHKS
jgi:glycosyltransferase involved in cell wall biosynthesis